MLKLIIPVTIAIITALFSFYYFLHKKERCPTCKSKEIAPTGKRQYKERSSLALLAGGSPDSYREEEYKCSNCGSVFMVTKEAVITS